jgi:hypothetical protein
MSHLGETVLEVRAGVILFVEEAVERAVRAQALAEGHVSVENVSVTWLRPGNRRVVCGRGRKIATVEYTKRG